MANVILKLKALENETFEPLWYLFNQDNIPFRLVNYKFGSRADIEILEEELPEALNALSTTTKYVLLKQVFV